MVSRFEGLEAIPEEISGYKVQEVVSRGASAILLKVTDSDGATWALKFVPGATKSDREFLAREVQNLQKLDSPRVSKFKELIEDEAGSGIVMEFVPGQNLAQMKSDLPLRGLLFRSFAIAVLDAVKTIHAAGLVHRDIKPENVVFGEDGVKVVDFGISMNIDSTHVEESGTPTWISPEQAQGEPATTASDIFNLGLLLSFAATGVHPFGSGAPDAVLYRLINKAPNLDDLPTALREPIEAALEKDPKRRPDLETLTVWVSGSGGLSGDTKAESNDSTVMASKTILGRVALGESRLATVAREPKVHLPRKKWLVTLISLSVLLLGAGGTAAYLYLGQVLPASGPVLVEITNDSENKNRGNTYIQVTNGLFEQELVLPDSEKSRVFYLNDELDWSIDSILSLRYVPSFSEDEDFEFSIDPRALGVNRLSDGLLFRVQISLDSEEAEVKVVGPALNGMNIEARTFLSKSLDRGNESLAIRGCITEEGSYLNSLVATHRGAPSSWRTIFADSGLNFTGSLYYTTWASRATTALSSLTDFQFKLITSRGPQGTPLYRQQLQVEDRVKDLYDSVVSFRSAAWAESQSRFDKSWDGIFDALSALEDSTSELGDLIFPQANAYCESRLD